ncbi:hypothetical protein [Marinicella rhabdoformis]|uniref:hypothetical protein n=1 Tax=Marinicella rhabdoformis TaxID=2580566 RepID=UPI0012AED846|nr:hypothetical protein [Marinicella rhabdoformis]
MLAVFLVMSFVLSSCGAEVVDKEVAATQEDNSAGLSDKEKEAYKAKVRKRMGKVVNRAAIKELGEFGVSEQQVKCVLKTHSYLNLASKKETDEVKTVFKNCGVSMEQLKGWYD